MFGVNDFFDFQTHKGYKRCFSTSPGATLSDTYPYSGSEPGEKCPPHSAARERVVTGQQLSDAKHEAPHAQAEHD